MFVGFSIYAQNNQTPSAGLYKQAEKLVNQRDFEKAKLTLKLYQKYEEKNILNWLKAQNLIIKSEIELNNFNIAENLIKAAKSKLNQLPQANKTLSKKILLHEAELFEIKNEFLKAEAIYRKVIKTEINPDAQIRLAHNLIDRVLSSRTKQAQKDYEELRAIVSNYEKNPKRNPLELIRIKQKLNSYQMVNKETLANLQKLETYWLKKDEFTVFKIYLNNVLRNYEESYKIWNENKNIISLKSHPLSVPVLVSLSKHFLNKKPKRSKDILKSLPLLVRDKTEKNLVELLTIEQLLIEKKIAEAMEVYQSSIKSNPKGSKRSEMEIKLAEAYLGMKEFKTCRALLKELNAKKIIDSELKSRKLFIDASLLQADGKAKEAAALFLRVGQTATNAQTALKSLFMAGKSFYTANQCNRAIIAFKILLEKKRNQFTDEALYYLSLSHAQCKDFPKALSTIDQLILTGKNPDLKKKALFEKGDYWVMAGNSAKAIEAYNDFTVVYTNDSRNAAIWYKIYKIHLKQKELPKSEKILERIIAKSSSNAPQVYSQALHQKALIHQLKGENRESISLWQKYLEFNQEVNTKSKDEIKLMLAAAHQNSESLNLAAAIGIYEEIIDKSKDEKIKAIALQNLLRITAKDPQSYLTSLKKLLVSKKKFTSEIIILLCEQSVKVKGLSKECESFISAIKDKDLRQFLAAKLLFMAKTKESSSKALELLKSIKGESYSLKKLILKRDLYLILENKELALNTNLEIIYFLSAKKAWNQSREWTEINDSGLMAVQQLIEFNRIDQANKVYKRLSSTKFPVSKEVLKRIEELLKVKK